MPENITKSTDTNKRSQRDKHCSAMDHWPKHDGEGLTISDMIECNGENSCDVNADCSNTIGGYNCQCKPGFTGDGFQCTGLNMS